MNIDWDKAIDHLRARGRNKGEYMDPDGKVCALGAGLVGAGLDQQQIDTITVTLGSQHPTVQTVAAVLAPIVREQFPNRSGDGDDPENRDWHRVAYFNDNAATTDDDVIVVLEKARGSA